MMAITTIHKLVSYLSERRRLAPAEDPKKEYFEFMNGLTTNFTERPAPQTAGEPVPSPGALRWRAAATLAIPALAAISNVQLGLWRYTPPWVATPVKVLLFILILSAQQDLVHAALIKKGLKPDIKIVDFRLFCSETYAQVLLRANPVTYKWLLRYIYIPLGGENRRLLGTLAAYFLSGLWHEYLLIIASMKITGLWFSYFALNGLLVCAESLLMPYREKLYQRLDARSTAYRVLKTTVPILNFTLNVCVAHLMFVGLEAVISFH
jgi:hypothetical protein